MKFCKDRYQNNFSSLRQATKRTFLSMSEERRSREIDKRDQLSAALCADIFRPLIERSKRARG